MASGNRKLVTIVTETVLEGSICSVLSKLGATGYTITNARGSGSRGVRDAGWESSGNVRIEVICNDEVAERIETHLRDHYYEDYAMVLYTSDVKVLRPEKF